MLISPAAAIHRLRVELCRRGLPARSMYQAHTRGVSVLSIDVDLTVWCYHGLLRWSSDDHRFHHPAQEPETAARQIIQTHRHPATGRHPYAGTGALPAATAALGDDDPAGSSAAHGIR